MEPDPYHRGERLGGKVALVVGGGSTGDYPGTGSAMAALFAAQGARVAVVGRTAEHTEKTVEGIRNSGGEACAVLGDTTREADCERVVAAVLRRYDRVDILVNNVAVHEFVSVEDFDEQTWMHIISGNVTAPLLMSRFVLPSMRASGGGSIINIGSLAGVQSAGVVGYGTAKGALDSVTRDMATELGKYGVRVNCVVPGHLHTPHVPRTSGGEEHRELRAELNMLGIEGTGWDAAWAALYFASDESRFVTGQSLLVDGGVSGILGFAQVMRARRRVEEQ